MIINRWSLFRISSLLFCCNIIAQEQLRFVTFPIPNYVVSKSEGTFLELTRDLLEDTNFTPIFDMYPPKRAFISFKKGTGDIFFPYLGKGEEGGLLTSRPFYYKKDFLFSTRDIKQLPTKGRVCLTRGYPYQLEKLNKGIERVYAHSDIACWKMLLRKRVDFFLCELQTGVIASREAKISQVFVYPRAVSSQPVTFAFQKSPEALRAKAIIDQRLREFRRSGKLKSYFAHFFADSEKMLGIKVRPTVPLEN